MLAVLAAPFFEELIFRGMLFRSLAGAVPGLRAAIWSAAVFAVCHPAASYGPVFVLGLAAAAVFARTGFLPAAMVTHAVYNLVVVLGQVGL